ncbi:MAG: hypothetical protein ACKVHU_21340 [Acidimicrobiales bacterium]
MKKLEGGGYGYTALLIWMGNDAEAATLEGIVALIYLGARLVDPVFRFGQTTLASSSKTAATRKHSSPASTQSS